MTDTLLNAGDPALPLSSSIQMPDTSEVNCCHRNSDKSTGMLLECVFNYLLHILCPYFSEFVKHQCAEVRLYKKI